MTEPRTCSRCGAALPADAPGGHCLPCLLQLGLAPDTQTDLLGVPPSGGPPEQPAEAGTPNAITHHASRITDDHPGDRIGHYKLLQQIGEGGCGVVYMAEQEQPVRRRVALKIIKLGMDTRSVITRFEAERQALAMMDHANIAKVLDAGATPTGRPYFVMELVRGVKITTYCDQQKLSTRQRLDLFIAVCQAIQHAHQKGIIHRDLKPSNILVTEQDGAPAPKIIDFGIAKATTDQRLTDKTLFTAFEQFIGTPAYMSPEQAGLGGLDIDTRSDIYSLGVLLYELLTGHPPFDSDQFAHSALHEILRVIREKEPPRPSARLTTLTEQELTTVAQRRQIESAKLPNLLRGDLDWIMMKALEKDRSRRYETANGFARDIERHLNNEPVVARPPSQAYRFQKLVRRNTLAVAAAGAVTVSLLIGIGVSTWLLLEEKTARERAVIAEQKAETSRAREADQRQQAEEARVRAEANEKKVEIEVAKSRQVSKFLQEMLKGVDPYVAMGRDTTLLRELLDQATERISAELTNQPEIEAGLRYTIGEIYGNLRSFEKAEVMHAEALRIRKAIWGENHEEVFESLTSLADVLRREGRVGEAEQLCRESLIIARKIHGDEHPDVARALNGLALVLQAKWEMAGAANLHLEALSIQRRVLPEGHLDLAYTLDNLSVALQSVSKIAEGEDCYREALAIRKKALGPDDPSVALTLTHQALMLQGQKRLPEAEELFREALRIRKKTLSAQHPDVLISTRQLAANLALQGKLADAASLNLGLAEQGYATAQVNLGLMYASGKGMTRDTVKALEWLRKAADQGNMEAQLELGRMYQRGVGVSEDPVETAKWFGMAVAGVRKAAEKGSAADQTRLGRMYDRGFAGLPRDTVEAAKWYRKAADQGNSVAQNNLGSLYRAGQGVEKDLTEAIRLLRRAAENGNPFSQANLGEMYERGEGVAQDFVEAVKWYRKAADQGNYLSASSWAQAAQELLARMYSKGLGVPRDETEAVNWYRKAAANYRQAAEAGNVDAQNSLAWLLATCQITKVRDGSNAVVFAEKAVAATDRKDAGWLDTLAAAYAESGDFTNAVSIQNEAIALLKADAEKRDYATRLKLYESDTPYRDHN